MSNSAECWEFSGRRLPEKSSFSQTCSRLSRYLKEKGSFGDLSLEMTCKPDVVNGGFSLSRQPTMMNLFPCDASVIDSLTVQYVKPMNLFHRQSSFSSSSSSGTKEEVEQIKETNSVKPESQTAHPLTIFYGGQVVVFDDFPAEKAKEVFDFANEGSAKSITSFIAEVKNNSHGDNTQNLTKNQKEIASSPNPVPNTSSLACELPIARRASLHRFLEKRKDRITSKAPYPIDRSTQDDLSCFGT